MEFHKWMCVCLACVGSGYDISIKFYLCMKNKKTHTRFSWCPRSEHLNAYFIPWPDRVTRALRSFAKFSYSVACVLVCWWQLLATQQNYCCYTFIVRGHCKTNLQRFLFTIFQLDCVCYCGSCLFTSDISCPFGIALYFAVAIEMKSYVYTINSPIGYTRFVQYN